MNMNTWTKIGIVATAITASPANADFIGWTASVRDVAGGHLVNVFAATSSAGDSLVSVFGGSAGNAGYVTTDSAGGVLQSSAARSTFAAEIGQEWDAPDSFLTIGGGLDSATGTWSANAATIGDATWLFTDQGGGSRNGFSTRTDIPAGLMNPWTNAIPTNGGWYLAGGTSPARNLASLGANRLSHEVSGGVHFGASSGAAAAASNGIMVAQLWVADLGGETGASIQWRMGATIRRSNGTVQQNVFAFTVPAPGGAILAASVFAKRRRRSGWRADS
jgi:hypothetical protein